MERLSPFDWSHTTLPKGLKQRLQELSKSAFNAEKFVEGLKLLSAPDIGEFGLLSDYGIPTSVYTFSSAVVKLGSTEITTIGLLVSNGHLFDMVISGGLTDDEASAYTSSDTKQWRILLPFIVSAYATGDVFIWEADAAVPDKLTLCKAIVVQHEDDSEIESGVQPDGTTYVHIYAPSNNGYSLVKMSNSKYGSSPPAGFIIHLHGIGGITFSSN